jgi:hypothetical protein
VQEIAVLDVCLLYSFVCGRVNLYSRLARDDWVIGESTWLYALRKSSLTSFAEMEEFFDLGFIPWILSLYGGSRGFQGRN